METENELWDELYLTYSNVLRTGRSRESMLVMVKEAMPALLVKHKLTSRAFYFSLSVIMQCAEMNHPHYAKQSNLEFRKLMELYRESYGVFRYLFKLPKDRMEAKRRVEMLVRLLTRIEWHPDEVTNAFRTLAEEGVLAQFTYGKHGDVQVLQSLQHMKTAEPIDWNQVYPAMRSSWMITNSLRYALLTPTRCHIPVIRNMDDWISRARVYVVLCALEAQPVSRIRIRARRLATLHLIASLTDMEKLALTETLLDHPLLAAKMVKQLMTLSMMSMTQGMDAVDSYAEFFDAIVIRDRPDVPDQLVRDLAMSQDPMTDPTLLPFLDMEEFEHGRVHGRTLHHPDSGGGALKLPKLGKREELYQECKMINAFQRWKDQLGLKSQLPSAARMVECDVAVESFGSLMDEASKGGYELDFMPMDRVVGLHFQPPVNYRVHLHQVATVTELIDSSKIILHDVAVLARMGFVSNAPSDLFHNEYEDRRFQPLRNLYQRYIRYGTGRCSMWRRAVQHENFGPSGIRDLKHFRPLDNHDRVGPVSDYLFSWVLSVCQWHLVRGGIFGWEVWGGG